MPFDYTEKPDPAVCPRQFCFCWQIGRVISSQTQEPRTITDGCRNPFGVCTRLDSVKGDTDWYETHDPNLEEAGIPWFYFISSPHSLVPEFKERYIVESEALWGKEHWKKTE